MKRKLSSYYLKLTSVFLGVESSLHGQFSFLRAGHPLTLWALGHGQRGKKDQSGVIHMAGSNDGF